MTNKYLEKAASNALSRRLNNPVLNMSVGGGAAGAGMSKAVNAVKAQGPRAMLAAGKAQGGRISAADAVRAVNHGGVDKLAPVSSEVIRGQKRVPGAKDSNVVSHIHERLAARRSELGLSAANGNRPAQIANANALRAAGTGGSLTAKATSSSTAANVANIGKAIGDARAGFQTHLDIAKGGAGSVVHSAKPVVEAAKTGGGLLAKAKGLLQHLPSKKNMLLGAGAIGAGALAARAIKSNRDPEYSYS